MMKILGSPCCSDTNYHHLLLSDKHSQQDDETVFESQRRWCILSRSEVSVEEEEETVNDLTKLTLNDEQPPQLDLGEKSK